MMVEKPGRSFFITKSLNEVLNAQDKSISKLASGKRIVTAGDDPAGLSMAMNLEALSREIGRQSANRLDEISLMQTAEGALGTVGDAVQRIRELSLQAANGTLTDDDRQNIQLEIDQLTEHVDQVANNTEFNTKKLLDGTLELTLQNGDPFAIPSMTSESLGLDQIEVGTQDGASAALAFTDNALDTVVTNRSSIGAVSNGITAEIANLNGQLVSSLGSLSRIADLDMAQEMVNLTSTQLLSQAAIKVFQVDSAQRSRVLDLLS